MKKFHLLCSSRGEWSGFFLLVLCEAMIVSINVKCQLDKSCRISMVISTSLAFYLRNFSMVNDKSFAKLFSNIKCRCSSLIIAPSHYSQGAILLFIIQKKIQKFCIKYCKKDPLSHLVTIELRVYECYVYAGRWVLAPMSMISQVIVLIFLWNRHISYRILCHSMILNLPKWLWETVTKLQSNRTRLFYSILYLVPSSFA